MNFLKAHVLKAKVDVVLRNVFILYFYGVMLLLTSGASFYFHPFLYKAEYFRARMFNVSHHALLKLRTTLKTDITHTVFSGV